MPWHEASIMSERYEFVKLATAEGANVVALCRRFGISPAKGCKWLARFAAEGRTGLENRSRRPNGSPARTSAIIEQAVLEVRTAHPT